MTRFRLCEDRRLTASNTGQTTVHARLVVRRASGWEMVGIFRLTEDEWAELAMRCESAGVLVVRDDACPVAS